LAEGRTSGVWAGNAPPGATAARHERRDDILFGFADLAATVICLRILHSEKITRVS
jgi:hypothetical protein